MRCIPCLDKRLLRPIGIVFRLDFLNANLRTILGKHDILPLHLSHAALCKLVRVEVDLRSGMLSAQIKEGPCMDVMSVGRNIPGSPPILRPRPPRRERPVGRDFRMRPLCFVEYGVVCRVPRAASLAQASDADSGKIEEDHAQ